MTKVAILPEATEEGTTYRAVVGEKQSVGRTAGEALDALTPQLPIDETGTLVIIQNHRPDRFFSEDQQQRLEMLMSRWRVAWDTGGSLPTDEQKELETLVAAELRSAASRAAAISQELGR
jgi:hypothetical protein